MISSQVNFAGVPSGPLSPEEYDQWAVVAQTGGMTMSRTKRDGRNPSTGARGSRRYGQTITFITGLEPLTAVDGTLIY